MKQRFYSFSLLFVALLFIAIVCYLLIPPLMENFDVMGAFSAGFVNPYSSAYAADAILCWVVLFLWVVYEYPKVKYGWVCLLLGLVPGVAVGFALYLILRTKQVHGISEQSIENI
ncbi:MAG: hypothetical protein ACI9O4_002394 [Chitinophagales bacterium]|jgi:hypothetical protein